MASILVVGGGVAGLTCAWRLQRAGHDVEVLEREATPGGRMRSESRAGFTLERGAQFVASGYRNLQALVRLLGLEDRLRPWSGRGDAVLRDGRLRGVPLDAPLRLLRSPLLSPRTRARLPRLALELWRGRHVLDPLHPESAALLDRESLVQGATRVLGSEGLEFLLGPIFSGTFDCEPEDLSWTFALLAMRMLSSGSELRYFEGGNGAFPRALAEGLRVRTGCEVVRVETETDGARVEFRARGHTRHAVADACVVALPGSGVAACCPKLTPAERGFFEGVRYGRGVIVHLLFEREPATLLWSGISFPRRENPDLYALGVDHHRPGVAPVGAGLVNAALSESAARRRWRAPDAAIADLVVESLAYTPIGRLAPADFAVHRWPAMLPRFGVGALARLARFLNRAERSPRLAFAGDYLVGPFVEGAVTSGLRAASEIGRALGP